MTTEQIDKIRAIINIVSRENTTDNKMVSTLCNEILYLDASGMKAKKGNINLYDYVSKDDRYNRLTGVYHNNGEAVASDAYILLVRKNYEYNKEFEGKIISKSGEEIPGKYPDYNAIKPTNNTEIVRIDRENFSNALRADKAKRKLMSAKEKKNHRSYYKFYGMYFDLYKMEKFINAMDYIGTENILCHPTDIKRAIMSETEKGWIVLMPYANIDDSNKENQSTYIA